MLSVFHYLCQGGHAIVVVYLFVCLLATLHKNIRTDLHELLREGWQWAVEPMIKFWRQSGSWIQTRICIAILVRHTLAEVCIHCPSASSFICFFH